MPRRSRTVRDAPFATRTARDRRGTVDRGRALDPCTTDPCTNGVWNGYVTINSLDSNIVITAEDTFGQIGTMGNARNALPMGEGAGVVMIEELEHFIHGR